MLDTASDTFRILACLELCLFRYMQAYLNMISTVKAYSRTLKHYYGIFRHIQHCVILASEACNILSNGIFRTWGIFETYNFDQVYSELKHYQNSLFRNYSAIFKHIQNLEWRLDMQKLGIFGILIQNLFILAAWHIFRTLSYSQK